MGWSIGYDDKWKRDIGYGVPAICDHPDCNNEIDRGLGYVCGGEPYGGDKGCGLHFCTYHLYIGEDGIQMCERCCDDDEPFEPKPDVQEWVEWKLTDESWQQWRNENPDEIKKMNNMNNKGVDWYIGLTDAEQGQLMAFSTLLDVEVCDYDNLADFLNSCRMNICDLLDKSNKVNELQDFAIWMTGCGYDFTSHPYFCQQRDKLLKS